MMSNTWMCLKILQQFDEKPSNLYEQNIFFVIDNQYISCCSDLLIEMYIHKKAFYYIVRFQFGMKSEYLLRVKNHSERNFSILKDITDE